MAIGLIIISFWVLQHMKSGKNGRLPPGPFSWPIIGNLHQLTLPAHRTLKQLADKYGPIFLLRLGSVPTVVVSSTEMATLFLKTHDLIFAGRPLTAVGKYLLYNYKDVVLAPYGDYWRQMRKVCVLELLTPKRIESFKSVREEEASAMIRSIWKESLRGTIAVDVSKAVTNMTWNTTWRILVGKRISDEELRDKGKGFKELVLNASSALGDFNIGEFVPYLDWLDLQGVKRRMKAANKTFDVFAEHLIEEHANHRKAAARATSDHGHAEPVKDFVDVLLDMAETDTKGVKISRENIKALLFDMFAGGIDTTSSTLEWAMSELLRHPLAMKRLRDEIDSVVGEHRNVNESDLASMKYLHFVVKETLRLYPPVPIALPHESLEAATVGAYYIPKKAWLIVNLWAIGRDPSVWGPDASEFKPDRFIGKGHIDFTAQADKLRMIPFGAGRRGCPGFPMAIPVIELALAQLLHVFDWRVEGDPSALDMSEACGVTLPRKLHLFAFPTLKMPCSP